MLPRIPEARGVPAIQAAASAIQRAVIGQAKIIDDLLDMSRVRTGKLALDLVNVDLSAMLVAIADAIESDAASRGIALAVDGIDKPVWMKVDPVRFDQVVWNLLSNALKFTPRDGRVIVRMTVSDSEVHIVVADNGQGIESALVPHIFDMFAQGLEARRKTSGGMGIGLALVKQLVEMHGGRVLAHSAGLGQGTTLTVILPMAGKHATDTTAAHASPLRRLHVLIVDDDPESASALASLMELEGARPLTASTAADAMDVLRRERIDLLVCDVRPHGASAHPLIEQIRQDSQLARLPAIALIDLPTSADSPHKRVEGFDLTISKPVSLDALIAAIEEILPA
jgi:two-component system CheB/CheR fusion protein